jgi:hypothetical protein
MPRQGRDTTKDENSAGRGLTWNSIFVLKNKILLKMDRNYIQTGLKPGQHEEFRTYWGWSILAPACPGWVSLITSCLDICLNS